MLAEKVYQHKMKNIATDEDERKVNHDYERFKKRQAHILSICDKRIRDMEDVDYVMLEGSMSSLHLKSLEGFQEEKEPEISKEYIKLIGGDYNSSTISNEISQYQPSDSKRTRIMKDALDTVWEFTHDPDINKDGKINSHTMKEMWDYCAVPKLGHTSAVCIATLLVPHSPESHP